MDFVHDYLADRRKLRTFNVVDAFTRECLGIEVDTAIPARCVVAVLDKLVWLMALDGSGKSGTSRSGKSGTSRKGGDT